MIDFMRKDWRVPSNVEGDVNKGVGVYIDRFPRVGNDGIIANCDSA